MAIPTVDLSPFFRDGDLDGQNKTIEIIKEACSEYGVFQIVNNGVPIDLMNRAIRLSETFFASSDEEKLKYSTSAGSGGPLPTGYRKHPVNSLDKYEHLLMFQPQSDFNILPTNPPHFRDVLEEMFIYLRKTSELLVEILNDCLNLPPNFLKEYNQDRSCDFMVAWHYFPATDTQNYGLTEHEDGNIVTLVIQDELGGLEVKKDGKWIPVFPHEAKIVVNICDVIKVLSNNKVESATHRVVRSKERSRHSFAFFYNIQGDKWIEPLPQFTEEIGEKPKYRGFLFKDYQAVRMRNKYHPPPRPEDAVTLNYYAISKE